MARHRKQRLAPSFEDLVLFQEIAQLLDWQPMSLREVDRQLSPQGTSRISVISQCLRRLEDYYGTRGGGASFELIDRQQSREARLTNEGQHLFDQLQSFLHRHDQFRQWPPQTERDEAVVVNMGVVHGLLVHLLSFSLAQLLRHQDRSHSRLKIHEDHFQKILEYLQVGVFDFAIGPRLSADTEQRFYDVNFHHLKQRIDVVLILHPGHRLAKQLDPKDASSLLPALSQEVVLVHPLIVQGAGVAALPRPSRDGDRIEMPRFNTIRTLVEMESGLVGLVPGWYWQLEEHSRQGHLLYSPVTDLGSIQIAVYERRGGTQRGTTASNYLEQLIDSIPQDLQFRTSQPNDPEPFSFPKANDISKYRWQYYVSYHPHDYATPEWHQGAIELKPNSHIKDGVKGHQIDRGLQQQVEHEYVIDGRLRENLLFFEAWEATPTSSNLPDRYIATFNEIDTSGNLIGAFTGFDENKKPITAPMILAQKELKNEDAQKIYQQAETRVIPEPHPARLWGFPYPSKRYQKEDQENPHNPKRAE